MTGRQGGDQHDDRVWITTTWAHDRVWITTTWAHVHSGATVRPPDFPAAATEVISAVHQTRTRPYLHTIVKAVLDGNGVTNVHDFDPNAPVEMLVSPATARAVAILALAGLAPQVVSEHETSTTNESENPS